MSDVSTELMLDAAGKPILRKRAHTPVGRQRLTQESAALARARHPGVVSIAAQSLDGPEPVLSLRWAGSHSLATLPLLSVEHAAGMLAAVATTVADLHELGVVHGRLSADHVVVGEGGRPLLCGFGAAVFMAATVGPRPHDDVAGLGHLLHRLIAGELETEPIPDGSRWRLHRHHRAGFQRRSLLTLADQAMADEVRARPTARALAASIRQAVPGARLPLAGAPETVADIDPANAIPAAVTPESTSSTEPRPGVSSLRTAGLDASFDDGVEAEPVIAAPEMDSDPEAEPSSEDLCSDPVRTTDDLAERTPSLETGAVSGQLTSHRNRERTGGSSSASWPGRALESVASRTGLKRHGQPRVASSHHEPAKAVAHSGPGRDNRKRISRRAGIVGVAAATTVLLLVAGTNHFVTDQGQTDLEHAERQGDAAPQERSQSSSTQNEARAASPAPSPSTTGSTATDTAPDSSICPETPAPKADVDADGCEESLRVDGGSIVAGSLQFAVGRPGDLVILGDWDCDGTITAAVARPTSEEVFVFSGWASADRPLTVRPAAPGSRARSGLAVDADGDGCDELLVTDDSGTTTVIDLGGRP